VAEGAVMTLGDFDGDGASFCLTRTDTAGWPSIAPAGNSSCANAETAVDRPAAQPVGKWGRFVGG